MLFTYEDGEGVGAAGQTCGMMTFLNLMNACFLKETCSLKEFSNEMAFRTYSQMSLGAILHTTTKNRGCLKGTVLSWRSYNVRDLLLCGTNRKVNIYGFTSLSFFRLAGDGTSHVTGL